MSYRCKICEKTFDVIPPDAVEVATGMYCFDGSIHDLQQVRPITEAQHRTWHRKTKVLLCPWCYPPSKDAEQNEESMDQQSEPEVTPLEEVVVVETATEEPMTAMQFAFAKLRGQNEFE
jgi:hypothetical protein